MDASCITCQAASCLLNSTGRRGRRDRKVALVIRCCLIDSAWKLLLLAADVMHNYLVKSKL